MKLTLNGIAIIAFLCIAASTVAIAQGQFLKVYGGGSYDIGKAIVQNADGGYTIAGSTGSFDFNNGQFMLIRTDAWGSEQWRKYYGQSFADQLESMAATSDGGFVMAGVTETTDLSYQMFVVRTDSNGDTLWTKTYGGSQWDIAKKIIALADGGFALVGQTYSYGNGQGDAYLLRLDMLGDTIWTRTYGGTNPDGLNSIGSTSDGGFILAGYTESAGMGGKDIWILRTTSIGDTIWTKTVGGAENDIAYSVLQTLNGGFAFAGSMQSGSVGGADFYLQKVDENGADVWSNFFGGNDDDEWFDLIQSSIGDLVTIGYSLSEIGAGGEDLFLKRVGADGIFGGVSSTFGSGADDRGYSIVQTLDNGYAMLGVTEGYLFRMQDALLVKTDFDGVFNSVYTEVNEVLVDGEFRRLMFAPNPCSGHAVFSAVGIEQWASSFQHPIVLELFDALGKMVLSNSSLRSSTDMDLTSLNSGIYMYRLRSGQEIIANGRLVNTQY